MATPWDRAAEGYLAEWVPRFVPYHLDLVRELALQGGQRVLVTCAGPGAEVLAVARAVGAGEGAGEGVGDASGFVLATDPSEEMVRLCREQVARAHLPTRIEHAQTGAVDAHGGPWDAIVCAFGLWQIRDRAEALRSWAKALAPRGKVGIVTWGPGEADEPFELLRASLGEVAPEADLPAARVRADREAVAAMFEGVGLAMVRHTVVRHTMSFASAEAFVRAMREACTWRAVAEHLGDERLGRVAARFYEKVGGPAAPLSFAPSATLAVASLPGADVVLASRPSSRALG
jgi:ubiquinone/menaquinone biosynthesis C-methylase UbiE